MGNKKSVVKQFNDECIICLDDDETELFMLDCGHCFHINNKNYHDYIYKNIHPNCPLCNQTLNSKILNKIFEEWKIPFISPNPSV